MGAGVKLLILFGSRAKNKASEQSDADIAVLADHSLTFAEKNAVVAEAAKLLRVPEERIDLVDLWNAPPLLQYQIAEHGKLLAGEKFNFVRFKVLAWKRYLDTAKLRSARKKALEKYVRRIN